MDRLLFLLTFDYEVPLGGASNFDQALFTPADNLLALANRIDVPIVLFADICSAIRFNEWDPDYSWKFTEQLRGAVRTGHDVQLHIHPHWMNSSYENGKFIPSANFGLSSFKNKTGDLSIESIIDTAYNALTKVCQSASGQYQCCAFRAGGYDMAPESTRILRKLYELGIRFDSSVVPGLFHDYGFSRVDYRKIPDLPYWTIPSNGPLSTVGKSDFFILPIATRPTRLIDIARRRLGKIRHAGEYRARRYSSSGWGYALGRTRTTTADAIRSVFSPMALSLDREYADVKYHKQIIEYQIRRFGNQVDDLVITMIGHPKSIGPFQLRVLEDLVSYLQDSYPEMRFTTYTDLYRDWIARPIPKEGSATAAPSDKDSLQSDQEASPSENR